MEPSKTMLSTLDFLLELLEQILFDKTSYCFHTF